MVDNTFRLHAMTYSSNKLVVIHHYQLVSVPNLQHTGLHQCRRKGLHLAQPPIMSSPEPDEVLFAYIVVALYAISLVLIRVDNGVQRPVYYMSKSLHEAEVHYLPLEKAILAVVLGTRKLPHYFQAHIVVILT